MLKRSLIASFLFVVPAQAESEVPEEWKLQEPPSVELLYNTVGKFAANAAQASLAAKRIAEAGCSATHSPQDDQGFSILTGGFDRSFTRLELALDWAVSYCQYGLDVPLTPDLIVAHNEHQSSFGWADETAWLNKLCGETPSLDCLASARFLALNQVYNFADPGVGGGIVGVRRLSTIADHQLKMAEHSEIVQTVMLGSKRFQEIFLGDVLSDIDKFALAFAFCGGNPSLDIFKLAIPFSSQSELEAILLPSEDSLRLITFGEQSVFLVPCYQHIIAHLEEDISSSSDPTFANFDISQLQALSKKLLSMETAWDESEIKIYSAP